MADIFGDIPGMKKAPQSRMMTLTYMHPKTLIVIVVAFMVVMAIALMFALFWGLTALIAMFFFVLAFIMVVLNRGTHLSTTVYLLVGLGVFFIVLSMAGISIMIVDFSNVDSFVQLHQFFQGIQGA